MKHSPEQAASPPDVFGVPSNPVEQRIYGVASSNDKAVLSTWEKEYKDAEERVRNPQPGDVLSELQKDLREKYTRFNRGGVWQLAEKYPAAEPKDSRDEINIKPQRMGNIAIVGANSDGLGLRSTLALARYGATPIIMQEKDIGEMDRKLTNQVPKLKDAHPIYREPCALTLDSSVGDYWHYIQRYEDNHAVVVEGDPNHFNRNAKFLGLVGPLEIARAKGLTHKRIGSIFKPAEKVVTADYGISALEAVQLLDKHDQSFLPILQEGRVAGVTSRASSGYQILHQPHTNPRGGLAYLVSIRNAWEKNPEMIRKWVEQKMVGIGFRFDRAHLDRGTKPYKFIAKLRKLIDELDPTLELIAGNLVTGDAALRAVDAGATGVCVGIGPSPQCITREVTGFGVPQITAIENVRDSFETHGHDKTLLIADGGTLDTPGHFSKVLRAGADHAMGSTNFMKTRESSPEIDNFKSNDRAKRKIVVAGNASGNVQADAKPRPGESLAQIYRRTQGPRKEGVARSVSMHPEYETIREALGYLTDGDSSGVSFSGGDTHAEAYRFAPLMTQTSAGFQEGQSRLSGDRPD